MEPAPDPITSWTASIPGVPPSVNHMYAPIVVLTKTGSYRSRRKADGVEEYQTVAALFVRRAMPRWWRQQLEHNHNYIRIRYWFYLTRDIDCDNALKALNDAIAHAIGVDDKRFLPSVEDKFVSKREKDPRVEIEVSFHHRGA